jgi:hypothetical protein
MALCGSSVVFLRGAMTRVSVSAMWESLDLESKLLWQCLCAMLIGYAPASTNDQNTAAQTAALKAADCERIFRAMC